MQYRRTNNVILSILIGALLLGSYAPAVTPQTHAVGPTTIVADTSPTGNLTAAKNTLTAAASGITASWSAALGFKELTLDGIAYALVRKVIQRMVASIVAWINSGFQGSPAFITDLNRFLLDVADEVAGDFIYGSDLGFLCSPFELDVRIALATQYNRDRSGYQPQCTLTGVVGNMENFLQGSFSEGGWAGWFELTQGETNDPNAAYLDAKAEFEVAIRNAQGEEITLLDWGDGFLSYKVCSDTQARTGAQKDCSITTPGEVIATQINETLSIPGRQLITADEINEIIGTLLAQLAQQALTGIGGLLGLGGNPSYSSRYNSFDERGRTYLEALAVEEPLADTSEGTLGSSRVSSLSNNALRDSITAEDERIDLASEVIVRIDGIEEEFEERVADLASFFDESTTCVAPNYPSQFTSWVTTYQEIVDTSTLNLTVLQELERRSNATTDPAELDRITGSYLELQQSGRLATAIDNTELELFIEFELREAIDALREDLNSVEESCRNARNR